MVWRFSCQLRGAYDQNLVLVRGKVYGGVRTDGVCEAVYDRGLVALLIENLAVNVSGTNSIDNLAENSTDPASRSRCIAGIQPHIIHQHELVRRQGHGNLILARFQGKGHLSLYQQRLWKNNRLVADHAPHVT